MVGEDKDAEKKPDAETPEGAEGAEGDQPKKKKLTGKKIVLFIVLPLLLIVGGAGGAYMAGVFGGGDKAAETGVDGTAAEGEAAAEEVVDPNKPPTYYNVPDMVVNLQSERSRPVYLKISLSLELASEKDIPGVEKVLPRVMDNFQVYLRELRVEELRGSAGMYRLREELLMRVNQAVQPLKIKDVLFREMLVQ